MIPSGESRGGTPSSVRAPKERAPHRKMRRWLPCVCRRSASFIYLFLESLIGRNGLNGRPKDRPHPCPSLDRTGFALDVTAFLQARDVRASRAEKTRAPRRVARTRVFAMKFPRGWPSELPLPRGERVGVRGSDSRAYTLSQYPLILSFSPLGRRDAACRPSPDVSSRMLHFFGRPLHMIAAHRVATRAQ
jgi:hypothetical protein